MRGNVICDETAAAVVLPHIFDSDLYTVFAAIGYHRAVIREVQLVHLLLVALVFAIVERMNDYRICAHHGGYFERAEHARLSRALTHCGIVPLERERSVRLVENDAVCIGKAALRLGVFAPAVADIGRVVARHAEKRKVERIVACALEREDALLKAEGVDHV